MDITVRAVPGSAAASEILSQLRSDLREHESIDAEIVERTVDPAKKSPEILLAIAILGAGVGVVNLVFTGIKTYLDSRPNITVSMTVGDTKIEVRNASADMVLKILQENKTQRVAFEVSEKN